MGYYRSVGSFILPSGYVVINMASLPSAQSLQSKKIQELSQQPLVIDRFPTVQPEWAFELIITGLDNYDATVKAVLDNYFSKSYVRDGQTLWVSQSYR